MQGDVAAAHDLYQESFLILQRIDYQELISPCLEGLASMRAEQGELLWAARLWGAAEAQREAMGTPLPLVYQPAHERAVALCRAQCGNEAFATAWEEGRRMLAEQAVTKQR